MRVVLPNGIQVHTDSSSDVDALIRWLGAAPAAVTAPRSELARRALEDEGEPVLERSTPEPAPIRKTAVEMKPASENETESEERNSPTDDDESWPAKLEAEMARLATSEQAPYVPHADADADLNASGALTAVAKAEATEPPKVGSGSPKWEADRQSGKPSVFAPKSVPTTLGSFALVGPTAERYYGQVVYLYRCSRCGTEEKLDGQKARRRKAPPVCSCPPLLKPEGELPPPRNPRLSGLTTLVGMTFGTWKVYERTGGGDGLSYWKCRCTKCGKSKDIAALGPHGLRTNPPTCGECRLRKAGKTEPRDEEEAAE